MAQKKGADGPSRRDRKSVLGATQIMRVQAFVTAAAGVARMPKSEPGSRSGSGYAQSLLNATPRKPELKVVALKRDENQTTVSVIIETPNGAVRNQFTTRAVLTEHNALATAQSITRFLIKDPTATQLCAKQLIELVRGPVGQQRAFKLGLDHRLMITSGEGEE